MYKQIFNNAVNLNLVDINDVFCKNSTNKKCSIQFDKLDDFARQLTLQYNNVSVIGRHTEAFIN